MIATKRLTARQVGGQLAADQVTVNKKVYTARTGFYFTHGMTEDRLVENILLAFPEAKVVGQGEVWKPFKGGATIRNQSHWWVSFTL